MVDDCVITFLSTTAHVRVITTINMANSIDGPAIDTRIEATIVQKTPANVEQLESCNERDRSRQWNCDSPFATVVYVHRRILAHGSHGGRRKSIVVIVSPLETLMLDVAETFTAMDTSDANFVSQHHNSGLPWYSLFKLLSAKSSSGTIKPSLRY